MFDILTLKNLFKTMDSLSRKMWTCTHAHIIHTSGSFSSSKADPCAQDSLFKVLIIKKIWYSCGKLYRSPRRKKNMPSLNNCPFFPMKYSLLKYSSILQKVRFNIFNLFNNKHGCILSLSRVISCSSYKKEWMARLGFDKKAEPQYLKHYYDMSLFIALCQGIPGTMII